MNDQPNKAIPIYKQPVGLALILATVFIIAKMFGVDTSEITDDVKGGLNDAQEVIESVNEFSEALSAPEGVTSE